jgi:predicted PurR-regulated permease PerM
LNQIPEGARQSADVPPALRVAAALRVLVAIAVGTLLYLARAALIPVALAVLISLMLTTPVEALYRRGLPRALSAVLILIVFAAALAGAVNLLWTPAQDWWASAPQTLHTIERKLRPAVSLMNRVSTLSDRASQIAETPAAQHAPGPTAASAIPAAHANLTVAVLTQTRAALVSGVTVVILTSFLLAGGPPMLARMSAALAGDVRFTHVLEMIEAVRREVSRYYGSIALINLSLGLATTGVLLVLGMPNPALWGSVVALLNFIPYVGSATALLILSVTAFVNFDTLGQAAAVPASYLVLSAIEGQILQPLVVGRHLNLNPIAVFLALWFGGWLWGIAGILIAVPSLVTLKVVAEHSRRGQALQQLLGSGNGAGRRVAAHASARCALKKQRARFST